MLENRPGAGEGVGRFSALRPSGEEALPSRAHAASPRPLARTHDTNTKRKRNRFPGSGGSKVLTPLNLRLIRTACILYLQPSEDLSL